MTSPNYRSRTPDYYLSRLGPEIYASLTPEQQTAIKGILSEAIPQPSPKLVDLRFVVDLIVSRFYVVLFIGKDRRKAQRRYVPENITRIGNMIAVMILLLGTNLFISASILLVVYLLKSAISIDVLPGHFPDLIKRLLGGS